MRKEDTPWLGVLREVGPPQSLHPKKHMWGWVVPQSSLSHLPQHQTKASNPRGCSPLQPGLYMQWFPAVPRSRGVAAFSIPCHLLHGGCRNDSMEDVKGTGRLNS